MSQEATAVKAQALSQTDPEVASPGASLRHTLDLNSWLDCRRAAEIALGVLEALDDAYRRGARHVGLQPENIFISNEGKLFIDGAVSCMAAQYLSPEEARGEPADERSDLYGLGVVLYEMLTDRVPFDGGDAAAIKHKHLYRPPEPPQVFRGDLTQALSQLVLRLLEKEPSRRPSRAELSAELRRIIAPQADGDDEGFCDTRFSDADDYDDLVFGDIVSDITWDDSSPAVGAERAAVEIEFAHDLQGEADATAPVSDLVMSGPLEQALVSAPPARQSVVTPAGDAIASMQRDPFDLPVVIADELPAKRSGARHMLDMLKQFAGAVRWRKENFPPVRRDDTRRRLLKVVLSAILVCAALQLYELHEMSSTRRKEAAAPFAPAPTLSPSPVGAATGQPEAVGHQPEAANIETRPPAQTVAQTPAKSPVGAPPARRPQARRAAAFNAASSSQAASVSRRGASARDQLRLPRGPSFQQWQRRDARNYRQAGAKAARKPPARDVNYRNANRKDKAVPAERKRRRRFLFFQAR